MRTIHFTLARLTAAAGLLLLGAAGCSSSPSAVPVDAGPVALRRLTAEQFTRSVHDVLGEHVTVPSRIDPDARGFLSSELRLRA